MKAGVEPFPLLKRITSVTTNPIPVLSVISRCMIGTTAIVAGFAPDLNTGED